MRKRKEEFFKSQKEANEDIRNYFRLCIKNIDKDNLYMLRRVCMYISMVYVLMFVIADIIMPNFKASGTFFLVAPLLIVYFFINKKVRDRN
ncbi:MAG: hypothetical protein J6Y86_01500, partial [Pseudobutyrivibrio sp.]|nr:hypothetical protein [Pseudobutyrivibrio sp.]